MTDNPDQTKTTAEKARVMSVARMTDCGPGEWFYVAHPGGFLLECGSQSRAEQVAGEINAGRAAIWGTPA